MANKCRVCREPIQPGTKIYQIAVGYYYRGYRTPTYSLSFDDEVHETCFNETSIHLHPQHEPYRCVICNEDIEHGMEVIYAVNGTKPFPPYRRPESRGNEMPYIAHVACWELGLT